MGNSPAFQYYPADLLTDTEVMFWDMKRLGCYWQMITFLWLNEGKFEYNIENLCTLFRVNHKKTAEKLWENIEIKFRNDNGTITHKRILEEMQKQSDTRLKRQDAGLAGALKRWGKDSNTIDLPMAKNSPSTPTTNTTPTPTSLIEIDKENSPESRGLGLTKEVQIRAVRFGEELESIFPRISRDEATTFLRVAQHLTEEVILGVPIEIFDKAIGWAKSAMAGSAQSPKALFVAKVKEQTDFKGRGKLLNRTAGQG